jgi:hypothetical protein
MLRGFLLIAQPPLLGEEGKFATPPFRQTAREAVVSSAKASRAAAENQSMLIVSIGNNCIG